MAGKLGNKKKKKSIVDELDGNQIILPQQTTKDLLFSQEVKKIQKVKRKVDVNLKALINNLKPDENVSQFTEEVVEEIVQDAIIDDEIETIGNVTTNDVVETIESIAEENTVENIPDLSLDNSSVDTLIVKERKDKSGYVKTKVTVSDNKQYGKINLSGILTELKKLSNGLIKHRKCDLRTIGNTNKKQLANQQIKLLKHSYTIKPTGGVVNKSTRVMLSLDTEDTSYIIVYFQKSRDKFITKVEFNDDEDWKWLAGWIFSFYETLNFNLSKFKLINRVYNDDIMFNVIKNIAKTGKFKVSMPDRQADLYRFKFTPIDNIYSHLIFNVLVDKKTQFLAEKRFNVIVTSKIDRKLYLSLKGKDKLSNDVNFTPEQLNTTGFLNAVEKFIANYDGLEIDSEDIYNHNLRRRATRKALDLLLINEGIEIVKVLNKDETKKNLIAKGFHPKKDYDSENIIFKYKKFDSGAVLQHMAIQQEGEDPRGYKSRPYLFKLTWFVNDVEHVLIEKHVEDIFQKIGLKTEY